MTAGADDANNVLVPNVEVDATADEGRRVLVWEVTMLTRIDRARAAVRPGWA